MRMVLIILIRLVILILKKVIERYGVIIRVRGENGRLIVLTCYVLIGLFRLLCIVLMLLRNLFLYILRINVIGWLLFLYV